MGDGMRAARSAIRVRDALLTYAWPAWVVRIYWRIISRLPIPVWARITLSVALPPSLTGGWVGLRRLVRGRDARSGLRLGRPGEVEREDDPLQRFLAENGKAQAAHNVDTAPAIPERTDEPAGPSGLSGG